MRTQIGSKTATDNARLVLARRGDPVPQPKAEVLVGDRIEQAGNRRPGP